MAFTVGAHYEFWIHSPRSGTSTIFTIRNIDAGTQATVIIAATTGSTALGEIQCVLSLDANARTIESTGFSTIVGGAA